MLTPAEAVDPPPPLPTVRVDVILLASLMGAGMVFFALRLASPVFARAVAVAFVVILLCLQFVNPRFILELAAALTLVFPLFMQHQTILVLGGANVFARDFFYASFFIYLLFGVVSGRFREKFKDGYSFLILLFLILCLVAVLRGISQYGQAALGESRDYIYPILFYFVAILSVRSDEDLIGPAKRLLFVTVLMIPVKALLFSVESLNQVWDESFVYYSDERYRFLGASEALAVSFCVITLFIRNQFQSPGLPRLAVSALVTLLLGVLAIAQIRSVWVATAVVFLVLLLLGRMRGAGIGLSFVLGILICVAVLPSQLWISLEGDFWKSGAFVRDFSGDETGSWRMRGWEQEMEVFKRSPILGQGLGGYSEWFDGTKWQQLAVHNGYVMVLSKFGLVGMAVLALAVMTWFLKTRKLARASEDPRQRCGLWACQACLLAHLVYAVFYGFTPFFWLLLGAGAVLGRSVVLGESEVAPIPDVPEDAVDRGSPQERGGIGV